jgi:hypothetical protein
MEEHDHSDKQIKEQLLQEEKPSKPPKTEQDKLLVT